MAVPFWFVGPFAPTLTALSAFWAPSIADLIGQISIRPAGKVDSRHKGKMTASTQVGLDLNRESKRTER